MQLCEFCQVKDVVKGDEGLEQAGALLMKAAHGVLVAGLEEGDR